MSEDRADVAAQYADRSLLARIDAALSVGGLDPTALDWRDLTPLDHFHSRGVAATAEVAAGLSPAPREQVLDVGCGLGGPARLFAATYGCHVTGIDLTAAAVVAAAALSARTGLAEHTHFMVGDALALPFREARFDHVVSQHAAMNIADRRRLYGEIRRVLKPGGRFAIHDVVAGDGGPLLFPVPWASKPEASYLVTADAMRDALVAEGFAILSWEDKTAVTLEGRPTSPSPGPFLGPSVVAGPVYLHAVDTFLRNLREGRADVVLTIAERH